MESPFLIVLTLLLNLFNAQIIETAKLAPPVKAVKIIKRVESEPVRIPSWVTHPPKNSFIGISPTGKSIEIARRQAMNSSVGQILQAMGAEYSLSHVTVSSGNLNHSKHELKERLRYTSKWFLRSIQQKIRECVFIKKQRGYICFILIRLSPSELGILRKLTIGSKVTARIVKNSGARVHIEIKELNGVSVTLTDFKITTKTINHHARMITLFAWKIPEGRTEINRGILDKSLYLKKTSGITTINFPLKRYSFKSLILGSKINMEIVLLGHDEIGRPVSVPVRFH